MYKVHTSYTATYPEAGAVSVSSHNGKPIAGLVLATHSEGNDGGEVIDHKVLERERKRRGEKEREGGGKM